MSDRASQIEHASGPVTFKRILVAVDDGSYADQLVAAAAGLTSQEGAPVLVVHVSELAACCGAVDHPALHAHEHAAVRSLVEGLRTRGVQAQSQLRTTTSGRVAEHLLDVAEGWHADLVLAAVGQPGRFRGRPWRRVLEKLLDEAPCPVLLLPRRTPAGTSRKRG
jgi:nucleotide-binding universal stress UspA family protein